MIPTTLASTLVLTILLSVGLFFFIKASVKDRTEAIELLSEQPQEIIGPQLQQYFTQRSYRIASVDAAAGQVVFEGLVRPSWFLAIFLTFLAAIGILCLALVLSMLFPQMEVAFFGLELLSPIAGLFYWRQAGRQEKVCLKFEDLSSSQFPQSKSLITVTGHRDELASLQQALHLQAGER